MKQNNPIRGVQCDIRNDMCSTHIGPLFVHACPKFVLCVVCTHKNLCCMCLCLCICRVRDWMCVCMIEIIFDDWLMTWISFWFLTSLS